MESEKKEMVRCVSPEHLTYPAVPRRRKPQVPPRPVWSTPRLLRPARNLFKYEKHFQKTHLCCFGQENKLFQRISSLFTHTEDELCKFKTRHQTGQRVRLASREAVNFSITLENLHHRHQSDVETADGTSLFWFVRSHIWGRIVSGLCKDGTRNAHSSD